MEFYPMNTGEAIAVVFDLRDPAQWTAAGEARRARGRERAIIHTLTNDLIIIEFMPGEALEVPA